MQFLTPKPKVFWVKVFKVQNQPQQIFVDYLTVGNPIVKIILPIKLSELVSV